MRLTTRQKNKIKNLEWSLTRDLNEFHAFSEENDKFEISMRGGIKNRIFINNVPFDDISDQQLKEIIDSVRNKIKKGCKYYIVNFLKEF